MMVTAVTPHERWKKDVESYNSPHLRLKLIAQIVNSRTPGKIVDLGCAKGTLKSLLNNSIKYIGVDFVKPETDLGFSFFRCDFNAEELPSEINESEMIVCSGLLEYIEKLPAFLLKLNKSIKSHGTLVASYFNMKHIKRRVQKTKGQEVYFHPDWRGFYSFSQMKKIFLRAGFKIEVIHPMGHSFSHSAPVGKTGKDDSNLLNFSFLSPLLAHQFIFVLTKN